jgi:hypothetical protein
MLAFEHCAGDMLVAACGCHPLIFPVAELDECHALTDLPTLLSMQVSVVLYKVAPARVTDCRAPALGVQSPRGVSSAELRW